MNCLAKLIVGLMLTFASLPALAGEPASVAASAAPAANLYVFRSIAYPVLSRSTLKVDGAKIASLKNRSYTSVHVASGVHHFSLEKGMLTGGVSTRFDMDIADNKVYFIEYSGDFGTDGVGLRLSADTREIDEATARSYMSSYRFATPAPAVSAADGAK